MLQALIYSPNRKGYTNFTDFVFESRSVSDTSIQKYLWSISDGTLYYNKPRIVHKFRNSGSFTVRLTVWDEGNRQQTTSITIQVEQFLSDTIFFKNIPKFFSGPGQKTETPFTVSFTTTITSRPPVISLYADNSYSIPYNASTISTWSDLIPTWRFYDLSGNVVSQLTAINCTPIHFNNTLIGCSGTASFYFVEDIGKNNPYIDQPTVIFATLQTSTQENDRLNSTQNTIQKATFWYTDKPIPTHLEIKETTISDIYTTKWANIKTPYLFTLCYGNNGYKTDKSTPNKIDYYPLNIFRNSNDNISFTYPDTLTPSNIVQKSLTNTFNLLPSAFTETNTTSSSRLQVISSVDPNYSLTYLTSSTVRINFNVKEYVVNTEYPVTDTRFFKQNEQGLPTAGFAFDSIYIQTLSAREVSLSASLVIPASSYTPSFFNSSHLMVVNPDINLINSVYSYPHTHKNLVHNRLIYDKFLETEKIESEDLNITFTTTASSYPKPTNLYCMAANPVDKTFWATDPDTSHIYKFDHNNRVLTAINFLSYFDTDDRYPNQKNLPYDRYTPLHIKQDGEQNLWISFYKNYNLLKINKNGTVIGRTQYISMTEDAPPTDLKIKERNLSTYTLIDIDSKNNIWATHTDYIHNELCKYSSTGERLSGTVLPSLYNPTSIHIDRHDNVWLTTAITPYLLKPSQDRYGYYWDWYNLREKKTTPLKWKDTRFVGLTNEVVEREIYPPGKYPKTWNRETFNGQALKTNYTFTITYSSRTSPTSSLSSVMLSVTAVDPNYTLEMLQVSSISIPTPQTFIATFPVSALNVFYDPLVLAITPSVTANIKMRIAPKTNFYYPGLYDTQTNYITAGKRIIIEVPKQRKVYNYLPTIEKYGTSLVQQLSFIVSLPEQSATDISRITAVAPDYSLSYLQFPESRALFTFKPTLVVALRKTVYPISALPIQNIISNYEPGLFYRVYNFDYYMQNAYSLSNTFTQYSGYRYNTLTTSTTAGTGVKIQTNFFTTPLYLSENDLITDRLSSIYDPITSIRQIIPTNYGSVYCFSSAGQVIKNYTKMFSRPESIVTDNNNTVWLTHNYNHFTNIDPVTDITQTWKIDPATGYIFSVTKLLSSKLEPNSTVDPTNVYNNGIRGIHVDMFNRIWLVSNNKQKVYMFYAPDLTKKYNSYNANLINTAGEKHKLTQSFGDPTGNIWFRRHILPGIQQTLNYILTGESNKFTVQPLRDNHYFRVVNESFDAKEQLKAYALPEVLNKNTILFDELIGSILGNVLDNRENIGRNTYEKIANFSRYHNDIDFANIDTLYSLGQMLGVEIEKGLSKLDMPAEIKRIINFTSIPYKKLFGFNNPNINFDNSFIEPLHTKFAFVTAGEVLIISKPQTREFFTYTVPTTTTSTGEFLSITTPIPVSILEIPQLQSYMFDNYEMYRVVPTYINQLTGSFIDWTSSTIRLASGTKVQDWYKNTGVIEEMFNYILTKNLLT